jgi:YggT family protein
MVYSAIGDPGAGDGEGVMFVIANFLFAIAKILDVALSLYMWVIIIRAVLSWVNVDPRNPIVAILCQLTDPLLWRIRRYLPLRGAGIDISPIIAILSIIFLRHFVVATLFDIAKSL